MRIDSHLHFWKYEAGKRSWITDEMTLLQKDYSPEDVQATLQQVQIEGCIAVQSQNGESENTDLLQLAATSSFIKGVVCWTDLQANDIEQKLMTYNRNPLVKGFRQIIEGADAILLETSFKRGVELLSKNGFTYDILANTEQLRYAYQLAAQLPNQKFVIDLAGKPPVGNGNMADWKRNISLFGPLQNVFCKVPGINMEMGNDKANLEAITPALDILVETFGTNRLMYGSNWPVCLLKTSYSEVWNIIEAYFQVFSDAEKEAVFGKNAANFYNL